MKLSIIVPVYNMAADGKLNFCMDSLLGQTLAASEYEVIAVDDASTDESPAVLREYERKYPETVKVLYHERNRRQGGARNEGLKAASGEWIGFVDSDDWVARECYEKLLRRAEETGADVVGCDYSLVTEHTFTVGQPVQNNSEEQTGVLDRERHGRLLIRPGSMVVKIYRRSVIRENHLSFPEGIFYEDNCAAPLWSLCFRHFERVEEPLYYYYQHGVSTVHHVTEERCRDRMRSMELFYRECAERGFLEEYKAEIEYRFTELYYVITLFSYVQGVRHPKLSFIRELREGVEKRFPRFRENQYYRQMTGEAEQRFVSLQARSDFLFMALYRCKSLVWKLKGRWRWKTIQK